MDILFILLTAAFVSVIYSTAKQGRSARQRAEFINHYRFPNKLKASVLESHPHLTNAQLDRVIETLREYFHVCNEAGNDFISMPSRVVDTAWHEFILFTRQYQQFCEQAFGRFLHHTPSEDISEPSLQHRGLRNTWRIACSRVHINPDIPAKLPMLFAIDAIYKIKNGYQYSINCGELSDREINSGVVCLSDTNTGKSGCGAPGMAQESSPDTNTAGNGCGCGAGCGS